MKQVSLCVNEHSRGGSKGTLRVVSREEDSRKSPEGWKATLVTGPECAE